MNPPQDRNLAEAGEIVKEIQKEEAKAMQEIEETKGFKGAPMARMGIRAFFHEATLPKIIAQALTQNTQEAERSGELKGAKMVEDQWEIAKHRHKDLFKRSMSFDNRVRDLINRLRSEESK